MSEPYFSIITCTWNSEKYINALIKSVSGQQFTNYEHIIIDGRSTDKTLYIINKYKNKFPSRVRTYTRSPKGISDAMNFGMSKSRGKYIIHLESDSSFYDNNVLIDVYNYLSSHQETDWIYGKINVVNELGNSSGIFPNRKLFQMSIPWLIKYFNFVPHESVFMKKYIFDKFGGFDDSIRTAMDLDYWLRIRYSTNWNFFDRIITNYGIRPDALSSSEKNRRKNMNDLLKVQKRYSTIIEVLILNIFNFFIDKYNKTYR